MNLKPDTTLDILYTLKVKYFNTKITVVIPKLNKQIEELKELKTL